MKRQFEVYLSKEFFYSCVYQFYKNPVPEILVCVDVPETKENTNFEIRTEPQHGLLVLTKRKGCILINFS